MEHPLSKALRQIYLFRELPDDVVHAIATAGETTSVDKGEVIVREGADADALYLLRSGSVRVSKEGSESEVVMLGSGSHFGEIALIDAAKRSATVTANERCELVTIRAEKLRQKLDSAPQIAVHFYKAVAQSLARRLRATTDDLGFARQYMREHQGNH